MPETLDPQQDNLSAFNSIVQNGLPFGIGQPASVLPPRNRFADNPVGTQSLSEQSLTGPTPGIDPVVHMIGDYPVTQSHLERIQKLAAGTEDTALGFASPIKSYHGSPHLFSGLDATKIGTGEGAQAYGYGHYSAGEEGIAEGYRDKLSRGHYAQIFNADGTQIPTNNLDLNNPRELALDFFRVYEGNHSRTQDALLGGAEERRRYLKMGGNPEVINRYLTEAPLYQQAFEHAKTLETEGVYGKRGHMYEMQINAEPHQMLDWDAKFGDHHPDVQAKLSTLAPGATVRPTPGPWGDYSIYRPGDIGAYAGADTPERAQQLANQMNAERTGKQVYHELLSNSPSHDMYPDKWVAEQLRTSGIPGIQYYDGSSRAAARATPLEIKRTQSGISEHDKWIAEVQKEIDDNKGFPGLLPRFFEAREARVKQLQSDRAGLVQQLQDLKAGTHLQRNYVVFPGNENIVEILRRYGIGAGALGAGALSQQDQ